MAFPWPKSTTFSKPTSNFPKTKRKKNGKDTWKRKKNFCDIKRKALTSLDGLNSEADLDLLAILSLAEAVEMCHLEIGDIVENDTIVEIDLIERPGEILDAIFPDHLLGGHRFLIIKDFLDLHLPSTDLILMLKSNMKDIPDLIHLYWRKFWRNL